MTHHKKKHEKKEENDRLKALVEENEKIKDQFLRLGAEFENFKKRIQKEKEQFVQFSNEKIFLKLLPIIDDFDRAHEVAKAHKDKNEMLSEGVEMILSQLHKLLKDNGVEKIKTVGEAFDPHMHEAIGATETSEYPEDTVAEEVSCGYTLNGRLLRAAKVKIAKGENKNE